MKVIAEVGSNWKSLDDCLHSIRMAKVAGADIVKFQYFSGVALYGPFGSPIAGEMNPSWLPELQSRAEHLEIEFMCTAFSPVGYMQVNPLVDRHKIASAEITSLDILETVNSFRKPVLLSTGGASEEDIAVALLRLKDCPLTIMYCVTDYPARIVDFRHLEIMRETFGSSFSYGYSDHSTDVLNIPVLARSHGSVILEKHVNFAGHTDTPDAPHSLKAFEFEMMIKRLNGKLSPAESVRQCPWQRIKTDHGYFRPLPDVG